MTGVPLATPVVDQESAALLAAVVRAGGPVLACDRHGLVRLCSPEAHALIGAWEGRPADQVDDLLGSITPLARNGGRGPLAAALHGTVTRSTAVTVVTPAGRPASLFVTAGPLTDQAGELLGAILTLRAEHHSAGTAYGPLSGLHDPLTGLPNRRLLVDRLAQAASRTRRDGSTFEVLMIDLDRFKQVNDEYGHEHGDRVLREIGARLARTVRPGDTVARTGGDEFVALCERVDVRSEAETIAARLVAAATEPVTFRGIQVRVGASIGMTLADPELTVDALLHQADLAMYEAKRRGRGGWVRFDDTLELSAHRRAHLVTELRAAITHGTLEVAYQPEVELRTGTVTGHEALVRWNHDVLGSVPAEELVRIAEQTDLVQPLGALVLDRACAVAARCRPVGHPLTMSVNLSARELSDPDLTDRVVETLTRHGVPPSRLCLEITESSLIEATWQAEDRLERLRAAGVSLSIDDFGTGFASLTYLQRLPLHQVKIDKSFVENLPASRGDDIIVTSVINLAHNLDLTVVAEGIETPAQAAFLRSLGCDLGQGFLFGRPAPAEQLPMFGPA